MAYRSSVHESTGISPYRLMFGEECTLPDPISSPYAVWVRDALEVAYDQVRRHSGQVVQRQKRLYDRRAVRRLFAVGYWVMRYYPPAKKCKLDSIWVGPFLVVSAGLLAFSDFRTHPLSLSGCEESSPAWGSDMDGGSSAGGCSHDSRVGRQYHGSHFTGIPLCRCFTS